VPEGALNTFVILFVVIDPIGLAPMFVGLTPSALPEHRREMAVRATALAALILVTFALTGARLLDALGIGLPAFRIAGGALLFLLAVDMVFARRSGMRSTTLREQVEAARKEDISVFPLAFPLIAGPGALTTVLLMASVAGGSAAALAGLLAVLAVVLATTLGSLLLASRITRLLGETGANVVGRLLGLILAALAMQFMVDGVRAGLLAD
jgi:multiple antibiotic resistance protein